MLQLPTLHAEELPDGAKYVVSSASTIGSNATPSKSGEPRRLDFAAEPLAVADASAETVQGPKLQWRSSAKATKTEAEKLDSGRGHTRLVAHEQVTGVPTLAAPALIAATQGRGPARIAQLDNGVDPFDDPFGDNGLNQPGQPLPLDELDSDLPKEEPLPPLSEEPLPMEEPTPAEPGDDTTDPFGEDPVAEPEPMVVPPTQPRFPEPRQLPSDGDRSDTMEAECAKAFRDLRQKKLADIDIVIHFDGVEGKDFPQACDLDDGFYEGRDWYCIDFTWTASGLCHKPLYFEDVNLERYGHSWGPIAQPAVSAAHFFLSVPVIPYKMGVTPPNECIYALGYYRPGDCAPYFIPPIPISARGAIFQAGAVVGVVAALP